MGPCEEDKLLVALPGGMTSGTGGRLASQSRDALIMMDHPARVLELTS